MGSLGSRPKAPPSPQVVYVPAPTPTAPTGPTPEEAAADARRKNLLRRERGRFGTIETSFRGLLSLGGDFGQRKTLLGE